MITEGLIHVAIGGPVRWIACGGERLRFEDHPRFGPTVVDRAGEQIDQPNEKSRFWRAVRLWKKQGKRMGRRGECLWDEPPMIRLKRMWRNNYRTCEPGEGADLLIEGDAER